jgi:hypothetical protein
MYNILVFPCGSEIGLEVYRSLNELKEVLLFGASSVDDHGKFCYKNYFGGIPFINEPSCIDSLAEIVSKFNIDAIYPATDLAVNVLKRNENLLGCVVISSKLETTEVCLSKEITYEILKNIIKTPEVYELPISQFPVFAKPKIGYGSRGAKKIENANALEAHLIEFPNCIITEYLSGKEYTVDCFTNFRGELQFIMPRERARILNGISVSTSSYLNDKVEFETIARKINGILEFSGPWFFQVKRNNFGELVLLEIASRFGGSSSIWKAIGVNLPLLSIFNIFKIDVKFIENQYYVEMDRSLNNSFYIDFKYNHLFIDFDDCILIGNKININAVKLIYQCINNEIIIHLITRHKNEDLLKVLKKFKIFDLFDSIIHLKNGELKSDFIQYKDAIFIDDSFSERHSVHNELGIPTFGPESIKCLINEE